MRPRWLTLFVQPGRCNVYIDREMTTENPPQDQFASESGFLIMRSNPLPVKIILLMLLAAGGEAFAQDYYLTPNPKQPGAYYMDEAPKLGGRGVPFIQSDIQRAENAMIANPVKYQREPFSYQELENKYPVMDVVPKDRRYQIPIGEQMAMEDRKLNQAKKQAEIDYLRSGSREKVPQNNSDNFSPQEREYLDVQSAKYALGRATSEPKLFELQLREIQNLYPLAFSNREFLEILETRRKTNFSATQQNLESASTPSEGFSSGKNPDGHSVLLVDHKVTMLPYGEITIPKGAKLTVWKYSSTGPCEVQFGDVKFTVNHKALGLR